MKYKIKLSRYTRGFVEECLRLYNVKQKKVSLTRESMMPPITAGFSEGGGGKGTSDPTAHSAINIVTNPFLEESLRQFRCIDTVMARLGENEKKLIDIVYFRKSNDIPGAGLKLGYSEAQSYRIVNGVLVDIALEMGLITIDL